MYNVFPLPGLVVQPTSELFKALKNKQRYMHCIGVSLIIVLKIRALSCVRPYCPCIMHGHAICSRINKV